MGEPVQRPGQGRKECRATSGPTGCAQDAQDARVEALEVMVKELAGTVHGLAAMFKTFMAASAAPAAHQPSS